MGGLMIIDRDEESSYGPYGHIWYILIQADPQEKKRINNKFTNHPLALSWVACTTTILTPILNAYPHRILH